MPVLFQASLPQTRLLFRGLVYVVLKQGHARPCRNCYWLGLLDIVRFQNSVSGPVCLCCAPCSFFSPGDNQLSLYLDCLWRALIKPQDFAPHCLGSVRSSSCSACCFPARALRPLHQARFVGKAKTQFMGLCATWRFSESSGSKLTWVQVPALSLSCVPLWPIPRATLKKKMWQIIWALQYIINYVDTVSDRL